MNIFRHEDLSLKEPGVLRGLYDRKAIEKAIAYTEKKASKLRMYIDSDAKFPIIIKYLGKIENILRRS